jgi:hypothetical protein
VLYFVKYTVEIGGFEVEKLIEKSKLEIIWKRKNRSKI